MSRICVVVFGCLMGILAVLLNVAKVSLGWCAPQIPLVRRQVLVTCKT